LAVRSEKKGQHQTGLPVTPSNSLRIKTCRRLLRNCRR